MIPLFWLIVGSAAGVATVGVLGLAAFAVRQWKRSAVSIAEQRHRILSTRADG